MNSTTDIIGEVKEPETLRIAVFHKHVKDSMRRSPFAETPRIAVAVKDIRTIAESHIDGTTLIRTDDGGTIAVEESFDTANAIWRTAK